MLRSWQSRKQQQLKNKPWITKGIYTSICRKNKMHRSHYILGDEAIKREYKMYLNKLTKIKSIAKKQYFTDELEKNKSNQRKTWEILRSLLPGKLTKPSSLPITVNINGNKITDQQTILHEFNKFFSKVGVTLANNFHTTEENSFKKFLRNRVKSSMYMELARVNEVINLINLLNLRKSVGHDNISPYFLRVASNILAPALCYFIENAFRLSIFPKSCKIAKVTPLFKSGNSNNLTNYRPIRF